MKDTAEARQSIIDACRRMNSSGLNRGSSGNISLRAGDRMLITPSGVAYDIMTPEMIVSLPLSGGLDDAFQGETPAGLKPSSEWRFHKALLQARPDMNAVVHAHPTHCVALAMNRMPIPACTYMIGALGGRDVRVADYALFGGEELTRHVLKAIEGRNGCLMANHGAVVLGENLAKGYWRMEELEGIAHSYILSLSIGKPVILSDADMDAALAGFASYGLKTD